MYEYQEYPKCLYKPAEGGGNPSVLDVMNADEEDAAKSSGWLTAAEFHGGSVATEKKSSSRKKKDE